MLETARQVERAGQRHAKRRPKQLSDAPALLTSPDGHGLAASHEGRDAAGDRTPGRTGFSDDGADLDDEAHDARADHAGVHRLAREIAARLAIAKPQDRRSRSRGVGPLRSVPYRGAGDDLDLDRTLEALAEHRPLQAEDIIVRERRRRRPAFVLAVDVSGSMRGERLHMTAAAVGALTAELTHDDLAVVAFWSDAAALVRLEEHATLEQIIDALLAIEPRGLTNITFALECAEQELLGVPTHERRVILLSDCVHNAGLDPRGVAARLPRLDVLFDASEECDPQLARDLARIGRGRVLPVRHHRDVAPALSQLLAP